MKEETGTGSRYFAFLRAINVGRGRTVKMESLRRVFEALGFANVETFLASGNVVFETKVSKRASLEKTIEKELRQALGFEIETFIRTDDELGAIAEFKPFTGSELEAAAELNVVLLKDSPDEPSAQNIGRLRTATDEFRVHGREVYWLRRKKAPGLYSTVVLEKTLNSPFTVRTLKTVRNMLSK